jgi:small subunit ribosomal protein S6
MNKYELTIILKPNLEEEIHKAEIEKIHALITRFGGTIDKVDDWGKRRLAYEIDKNAEGFYSFIYFSSEGGAPAEIESRIRIMESLLRFLIIRLDAR